MVCPVTTFPLSAFSLPEIRLRKLVFPERALSVLNEINHYSFGGPMAIHLDKEKLDLINSAMEDGRTLEIVYSGGSMRGRPRKIVPRIVYNRDGVAYMTAHCMVSNSDKQFRLDRIQDCRIISRNTN